MAKAANALAQDHLMQQNWVKHHNTNTRALLNPIHHMTPPSRLCFAQFDMKVSQHEVFTLVPSLGHVSTNC